jgi:hypothetical protein
MIHESHLFSIVGFRWSLVWAYNLRSLELSLFLSIVVLQFYIILGDLFVSRCCFNEEVKLLRLDLVWHASS